MAIRLRPIPRTEDAREIERWRQEIRKKISALSDAIDTLTTAVVGEEFEILASGNSVGDDGNWKFMVDGNDLELYKKISGSWVTKARWRP